MEVETVRTVGSVACFFLWVKAFYWMRLFKTSAYFITLISQTLADIRIFASMVFVILCAFANFFLILNLNTPASSNYKKKHGITTKDKEFRYVEEYTKVPVIDALISMYLISVGQFEMSGYS